MLDTSNFNSSYIISNHINFVSNRVSFNKIEMNVIMENQGIRRTKSNIEKCKNEFINFILTNLKEEDKNWYLSLECNGDFSFKR